MGSSAWVHCIEPDPDGRGKTMAAALAHQGLEVRGSVPYGDQGYGVLLFDQFSPDLCELLGDLNRGCRERVLAGCCAKLAPEQARRLLQAGAADVLSCLECTRSAQAIMARLERWEAVDLLLDSPAVRNELVGESPAWTAVLRQVVEVARFTDASILILGESGTGKEGDGAPGPPTRPARAEAGSGGPGLQHHHAGALRERVLRA